MRRLYVSRAIVFVVAAIALSVLRAPALHAQAATLTGLVTSETGQILENANAFITELNISVATNAQGRYNIVIPGERVRGQTVTLRIRAIGHLAQAKAMTLRACIQYGPRRGTSWYGMARCSDVVMLSKPSSSITAAICW